MQWLNTTLGITQKAEKRQHDKTFLLMNEDHTVCFGFVGLFISQSFQMYKNKDVLQKQNRKKRNSPLPLSPVTTTTETKATDDWRLVSNQSASA